MKKGIKSADKQAFVYFAISLGACIYSLVLIAAYIDKGYIVIRLNEITGLFAIAYIAFVIITSLISGYMFKITKHKGTSQNDKA
jgi:hypothetical protein